MKLASIFLSERNIFAERRDTNLNRLNHLEYLGLLRYKKVKADTWPAFTDEVIEV